MIDPTKPLPTEEEIELTTMPPLEKIAADFAEKINKQEEGKLNERQELFCQLYATDREFFGNGVQTYIEVYEPDKTKPNWYKSACSAASQILSSIKVSQRINNLLEASGLNDSYVDKQLEFLITQHADFTNKLGAIREYNKLKARVTDKLDLNARISSITIKREPTKKVKEAPEV